LVRNALQHTPPGTPVTVRVASRVDQQTGRGSVVLAVSDDGPGMTPEEAARVFERLPSRPVPQSRRRDRTGSGDRRRPCGRTRRERGRRDQSWIRLLLPGRDPTGHAPCWGSAERPQLAAARAPSAGAAGLPANPQVLGRATQGWSTRKETSIDHWKECP
jgi:hypothetical protein